MLTKEIVNGMISVLEDKQLQVREDTVVFEDGIELSRTYMRYTAVPGDDVSSRQQIVQDIANLVWTPEVIAQWKAKQAEMMSKLLPPIEPIIESEETRVEIRKEEEK